VSESRRLDAVLPLAAVDLSRAQILFRSLDALFEPLGTCYVVAPDGDVAAVRAQVPKRGYVVLPDSELIPEIGYFRTAARLRAHLRLVGPPICGWYVQQLAKLAVAERIATPFYLTLDADVVCVRRTRYEDLVVDGRALVQTTPPNHPEWNDDGERVLGLLRLGRQYGVTPAVLSADVVTRLARHLERRVDPRLRRFARRLAPGRARDVLASWRSFLLRNLPWTEYVLYHTFLERTGGFDAYHVHGGLDAIYSNCVWIESEFDEWDPAAEGPDSTFCFSVVQSATSIAPERVWSRVRSLMNRSTAASSGLSNHARSLPRAL
jgi:Family of unknown function (DUF6492)